MEQSHADSRPQSTEQRDDEKRPDNDSRTRRQFSSDTRAAQPAKPISARQRWNEFRPSKTSVFWSLVAVVALTMLVGFTWGGWMTRSGAQEMADTTAKNAVVERLAPICVAQFNLDPDRDQKLTELQAASTYERPKYVTDQAWATLPGETKPTSQVASACANLLMQIGK
jgi:hypothetical protein